MAINKLDHINIRTADLAATKRFYAEVLGMVDGFRPPFAFPGAWIYAGDAPVIHVTDISKGSPRHPADGIIPDGTGMVDHFALLGDDPDGLRARLERAGVPFREQFVPRSSILQIFFKDPNGITVEINHPVKTAPERLKEQAAV